MLHRPDRLRHARTARARPPSPPRRSRWPPRGRSTSIRRRRMLALMLGDTSMGMINGYFGPTVALPDRLQRAQGRPGLAHRSRRRQSRTNASTTRSRSSRIAGVAFHWNEPDAEDFTPRSHARAAPRLPGRPRPARRVQGRLPGLAVPARAAQTASSQRLRRRSA